MQSTWLPGRVPKKCPTADISRPLICIPHSTAPLQHNIFTTALVCLPAVREGTIYDMVGYSPAQVPARSPIA
ncbi:hypothetical protein CY34DRAFT_797570 [Suillus luteus UH-Slu-Lm8-n1]|uniref:Uncharacterized protein n=1 Tax=Suillus luteus UH-Slu-Lm8-n1 TaxID=930992 RepID=A0A0D0BUF7_9AGAM|nr:hypothetical protein CY34DRAFT_797570 [Suillus luteus UH-Slu-Lm8-n1]